MFRVRAHKGDGLVFLLYFPSSLLFIYCMLQHIYSTLWTTLTIRKSSTVVSRHLGVAATVSKAKFSVQRLWEEGSDCSSAKRNGCPAIRPLAVCGGELSILF